MNKTEIINNLPREAVNIIDGEFNIKWLNKLSVKNLIIEIGDYRIKIEFGNPDYTFEIELGQPRCNEEELDSMHLWKWVGQNGNDDQQNTFTAARYLEEILNAKGIELIKDMLLMIDEDDMEIEEI